MTLTSVIGYLMFFTWNVHHPTAFSQNANAAAVTSATPSNGQGVVIVRNSLAPVVTTQVNYLVGSNEVLPGFPGTAHARAAYDVPWSSRLPADQRDAIMAATGR